LNFDEPSGGAVRSDGPSRSFLNRRNRADAMTREQVQELDELEEKVQKLRGYL